MEHQLSGTLLTKRVNIDLIGVGGSGAQMLGCLGRLDIAMREHGHPHGLHVRAFDPGRVRAANVGRQVYSASDIGNLKGVLSVTRMNKFFGLDWEAVPATLESYWNGDGHVRLPDILISCTDSRATRRYIHQQLFGNAHSNVAYWLDLGNLDRNGQVVLGQPARKAGQPPAAQRLPCVTELYDELLDPSIPDSNIPSCSAKLSLKAQGLYVNDMAARLASELLYKLFKTGRLKHHGAVFDLGELRCAPLAVDPALWRRMGVRNMADEVEAA